MTHYRDANANADVSANVDADAIFTLMLVTLNSVGGMRAMPACDDVVDNAMLCVEACATLAWEHHLLSSTLSDGNADAACWAVYSS